MPKLGPNDLAVQALSVVAERATAELPVNLIALAVPKDSALGWKAASVHPLQLLATEYQGIVNDATRGEPAFAARQVIESAEMGRFYLFDGGPPRLLGVGKGEGYDGDPFPLDEDALKDAGGKLRTAKTQAGPGGDAAQVRRMLADAYAQTNGVLAHFLTLPTSRSWRVPTIDAAIAALANLPREIAAIRAPVDANRTRQISDRITRAIEHLDAALEGVGTVQMFYSIERFYLFRLLVRYKIHADNPVTAEEITKASKTLTGLVTNGHPWLNAWLSTKIVDLGRRIAAADPSGNTLFFLKGGRAIEYLLGTPAAGTSDWDTQIVINPDLPAKRWYAILLRVSNAALLALKDYKAELYMMMYHNAATFERELPPATARAARPKAIDLYPHRANTKAELIDVGLPRYDTVEAREQWRMLRGQLIVAGDGMSLPGYIYYIDEYLMMIREVFAAASPSAGKLGSRINRLFRVLALPAVDPLALQHGQTAAVLRLSLAAIGALAGAAQPIKNALYFQLDQFYHAYGLDAEPDMAAAFDTFFSTNLPNYVALAAPIYPSGVRQSLVAEETVQRTISPGCTALADSIGFCQWISAQMEAHLAARAAAIAPRPELDAFYRCLAANSIFSQEEELEIQLAGDVAYAAHLYADYLQFKRPAALDPMTYLSLGIYCALPGTDPATVLEVVQTAVQDCVAASGGVLQLGPGPLPPGVVRIFWSEPMTVAPLAAYNAMAIEIIVHAEPPQRPLLSYVWGLAMLSLRDLIIGYQRRAAGIDEFGTRGRLTATIAALGEMLMQAANVEPPNLALAALARNDCHHLMISSWDNAVARSGDYPPNYLLGRAYLLTLTDNRPGFADNFHFDAVANRNLDLLVVNQGHGDIENFAHWPADDLSTYVVQPMVAAGISANVLVLDFCLSASLIGVFRPLLSRNGTIIATLYSTTGVVVTTDVWRQIDVPLQQRDLYAVQQVLDARLRVMAAQNTGLAHLEQVRALWTETDVARHLLAQPQDRDRISIIRYLPAIASAVRDPNLGQAYVAMALLRQNVNLGSGERGIFDYLPATVGQYDEQAQAVVAAKLAERVTAILTLPQYGLAIDTAGLQLFTGEPNLWQLLVENREVLLSQARGLKRCPTPYAIYGAIDQSLMLDAELQRDPLSLPVIALLNVVEPTAAADVVDIVRRLAGSGTVRLPIPIVDFLQ